MTLQDSSVGHIPFPLQSNLNNSLCLVFSLSFSLSVCYVSVIMFLHYEVFVDFVFSIHTISFFADSIYILITIRQ